ncbi:hypothetical protein DCAR_0935696 [Daucus carota subsp. sativus]|uniref:Uncharacterized protein n=1 Tax=Daucus carota subsp. sativus TaxID=79200 RepID=A0A175YI00_DAUCS|nr:PREDICTED: tRNA-splicing endonuclease subunit Sen54 isoform X1 [Daucus carota subsp. sativus]XP_017224229.1 PREDICTED: tRNA-splicing endonuclease subunit Sen54 isoform X1 [Daucus carota subsp. sativus]XP_017224230.1 PREDICTED: tRNA-splicing endonuclease subunit Sen54 isoform X1 [Daucus carota subsp. sativus]WOH16147.1 hypothetical protein DCAR_0935696 [Daucus carota subsp. sativus]
MEVEDYASSSGGTSDSELLTQDTNDEEICDYSGELLKFKCRKLTSKANWKDELGMAEIVSYHGRLWKSTGIVRDGKIYYSIEEALFMAEIGALDLLRDDLCLSLEEIYKMVSQGKFGCCWESFQVYRHLKSLGYIIGRHGVPWTLKRLVKSEPKLNEATEEINTKCDREAEDKSTIIEMFKGMHIDKVKAIFDVYPPNSNFKKTSPGNPSFVLCLTSSLPPSKQEISNLERQCYGIPLKFCNIENGRVSFFSFNMVELPLLP